MNEYRGSNDKTRSSYNTLFQYADSGCNKIIPPAPVTQVPKIMQMFQPHPYTLFPKTCSANNQSCLSSSCSTCLPSSSRCGCNPLSPHSDNKIVENYGSFSLSAAVRPPFNSCNEKITGVS